MKYYIQTLGCAMNYSDSERVAALLEKLGYQKTQDWKSSDLYIFNTCSIRQKGEDRVFGQLDNLDRLKKQNPRLLVGLTGCMVRSTSSRNSEKETKDDLLRRVDSIDFVFKITETHKIGEVLLEAEPQLDLPQLAEADLNDYLKINPKYTTQFQAFVPIQIGCDKYCTYCIVPYSRGREQSRPMDDILGECRALVEHGCKEITLVGQTVNSYGLSALDKKTEKFDGIKDPFVTLLTKIDALREIGLNRVRFTSPHPRDYTDALIDAHVKLPSLCPHFHLPIQAGNDDVLKKMNRKYTVEHYKTIVKKIREKLPMASITTDIIVGFCGETPQQFEDTYKVFDQIRWDMAYLARYSTRPGTVATKAFKDDVTREEKARRWHKLNDILEESSIAYNQKMVGRTFEILVEKHIAETGECEGKSRENKVIQFTGSPELVGAIVEVEATKALPWLIKGQILQRKTALLNDKMKKEPLNRDPF